MRTMSNFNMLFISKKAIVSGNVASKRSTLTKRITLPCFGIIVRFNNIKAIITIRFVIAIDFYDTLCYTVDAKYTGKAI